jgi:hypothetical protein
MLSALEPPSRKHPRPELAAAGIFPPIIAIFFRFGAI